MSALALWLASIGMADLVAGLSGSVESRRRALVGWAVGTGAAVIGAAAMGFDLGAGLLVVIIAAVTLAAWLALRLEETISPRRAVQLLGGLGGVVALLVATSPLWPMASSSLFARWLSRQPVERLYSLDPDQAVFILGSFLALQATANGVVRLLLASITENWEKSEQRLRGGRVIGPMERTLIFSFALAGQLTAAALVVSAKGLIRWPEINSLAAVDEVAGDKPRTIDVLTEYFLVGSLASWLLAIAPLVLTD